MSDFPATIHHLLRAYRRGEVSPVEVVNDQLARIAHVEPQLNAFVVVDNEGAIHAAHQSAGHWQRGEGRELEGVPITIKDLVAVAGLPTGEGSLTASQLEATVDAPVVARLREAGAIILGKTTTPEFGWKGMTDSPSQGITRNPWNLDHSPGGSSGGAAASLMAGIGAAAHGTDGGGSIRIPASYCGLYGLKPTFGRVPQAPVTSPYATLAANGPLARTVEDAALLLNVMSKPDLRDWHAVAHDGRDWRIGVNDGLGGLRIGYTETLGGATVETEVSMICRSAIDQISAQGGTVVDVGEVFEPLRPQMENYWKAGFASRLRSIAPAQWDKLDPGFRTLAEEGLSVDPGAIDAGYSARARLVTTMRRFHLDYDVLLTPTMPTPAPLVDVTYHSADFDRWDDAVPFTVPFNLTGQPAASLPAGVTKAGLPVGLQVVGNHLREDLVLRASRAILDLLDWHWSLR